MADLRVISIGALAAHPLWQEKGEVRPGHATTTLIRSEDARILVDPSLPAKVLQARLRERSGLEPRDVTHVFLTCLNPLHRRGLDLFPEAQWLVAEAEREAIGVGLVERMHEAHAAGDEELVAMLAGEIALVQRIVAAPDRLAEGVDLFPLPGVTPGLAGLLLASGSATIVVCGDAIVTAEHLEAGRVHAPAHDVEKASESFREAVEIADALVLGRDNIVLNPLRRF
ncbi:MAG TPA: MBL fold metallo-hydrolase [Phycisphaerales bacterium]|nr:MBL fold metallo-hydrolase [Phycisphaerales bacterium]HMP35870.1 MBL fold metallo-hydrolase [Phycisphaerales bacterium]